MAAERNSDSCVIYSNGVSARGSAVAFKQIKLQSESFIGGLCLAIAVSGINALVAIALVIAFR